MAWKLTVNGVDKTAFVAMKPAPRVSLRLNDRAEASFYLKPGYLPAQWSEVVIYAQDGVTPIFGGLIDVRSQAPIQNPHKKYQAVIHCVDFFTYLDWKRITLSYSTSQTLKQIVTDVIAQIPAARGMTVDGSQPTGPTFDAPPVWDGKASAADALRDLSTASGYVVTVSPTKVVRMDLPGATSAPFNITLAAPHCHGFTWKDPSGAPVTTVVLTCGTAGTNVLTQNFTGNGATTSWQPSIQVSFPDSPTGYVILELTVNGVDATVGAPGSGAPYEFDVSTNTLSVGTASPPTGTLVLKWLQQGPFDVTRTTGATPEVEVDYTSSIQATDPTPLESYLNEAQGILDAQGQVAKEATVMSFATGWGVGQAFSANLSDRDINSSFSITAIDIDLLLNGTWQYTITAQETTIYQGNHQDKWQAIIERGVNSAAPAATATPTTVTTVVQAVEYLGGARDSSVPMTSPVAAQKIINYGTFTPTTSFTATITAQIRARDAGVGVKLQIVRESDSVVVAESDVVTSTDWTDVTMTILLQAGETYVPYGVSDTDNRDPYVADVKLRAA